MDAGELVLDAKLYKASADIIPELQVKLPLLIWHGGVKRKGLRSHVPYAKSNELALLLDRFQEWPQLLDPTLASLIGTIVDGFTAFITTCPEAYNYPPLHRPRDVEVVPLSAALCHLLYAFCKVRGYKVIVRLLSNEPRYVEPMLYCLRLWYKSKSRDHGSNVSWQQKYIMLLWLSHLMLAPFELSTLSTSNNISDEQIHDVGRGLPEVARDVLALAFESLSSPSKERESAVMLLVRLALRKDMQKFDLAAKLIEHSNKNLLDADSLHQTVYQTIGHLALLYSIVNLGTASEVAPVLRRVYSLAKRLALSDSNHHKAIRDSAPARRLLVKILRVCMTHAIALSEADDGLNSDSVNSWLEDSIQFFLDCLGDKESPVRMAASKALGMTALKLDSGMAAEIVEAVLGALSENVLVEDPSSGTLMAKTERPAGETAHYNRNLSAVDPLRWHGLMLTLGHLLFRRSPPEHQLPEIIEALLLGLEFEQRSNAGTSLGVGVRDGACFGVWALARKYTTKDLEAPDLSAIGGAGSEVVTNSKSVLQLIASQLVLSACLDPSGNIRRGSSAALQELIGRHPDTISQGIPVVQVVDYTAVARRSRAMIEVAPQAAALDTIYHQSLLRALAEWRGAKAADAESRRWSSAATRLLLISTPLPQKVALVSGLLEEVCRLGPRNLGTNAGSRHGLLLSIAALVDSTLSSAASQAAEVFTKLESFEFGRLTGELTGRTTTDLEVAMEGICVYLEALARLKSVVGSSFEMDFANFAVTVMPVLDRCIVAGEKPLTTDAASRATVAIFQLMNQRDKAAAVEVWLDPKQQKPVEMACKGRLHALASVWRLCGHETQNAIVKFLQGLIKDRMPIETRTSAVASLCEILQSMTADSTQPLDLIDTLILGLTDYTNDQRGDVGSILRLSSLDAAENLYLCQSDARQRQGISGRLVPYILRLAAERMTKVRFRAWECLQKLWDAARYGVELEACFQRLEDVSTEPYFRSLLDLLSIDELRESLVMGLCSSFVGVEEVNRACCAAFAAMNSEQREGGANQCVAMVISALLNYLGSIAPGEDHDVLPAIQFLTFLTNQDFCQVGDFANAKSDIWEIVQALNAASVSLERIDVLMSFCNALAAFPGLQIKALDKLTRQLLHRYPKTRNAAADNIYTLTAEQALLKANWNASATTNKPMVLELRKTLRVVRAAAA